MAGMNEKVGVTVGANGQPRRGGPGTKKVAENNNVPRVWNTADQIHALTLT